MNHCCIYVDGHEHDLVCQDCGKQRFPPGAWWPVGGDPPYRGARRKRANAVYHKFEMEELVAMLFKDAEFCKLFQHHGKWLARVLSGSVNVDQYLSDDDALIDDTYTGTKWREWLDAISAGAEFDRDSATFRDEGGEPVFFLGLLGNTDGVDPFDERKIKKTCWPLFAFIILNLPPAIRCKQRWRLIHSIVGGPKAPSAGQFQAYVTLVRVIRRLSRK